MWLAESAGMLATRLVLALIFVGVGPGLARAAPPEVEPAEDDRTSPTKPDTAGGSHFLLEGSAGFGLAGASGFTWGGLLGAGGRVPGSPLRLYLVGELTESTSERQRTTAATTELVEYEAMDASLGLRGYVPVYGRLRFFSDALIGRTRSSTPGDAEFAAASTWTNLFALAAGLQLRVIDELSCGARGRVAFSGDDGLGGSAGQRWSAAATLTAHF
jgi:hypothetical protein